VAPPVGSDLSPTGRALRALELLQARPGVSAAELAERLGVTERAARRYVAILREAGIEVESTRGPYGGYRLGRGTRLPPVWFTQTEALSLVMAVLDSGPGDGEVGPALDKVVRALPERVGREAATLRDHAATAPVRHPTRPEPATTTALVAAVAARRRVRLSYRAESGNAWEVEVDPWAVVVRHGRWYLLCHSHRADATRTYRLDRIASVEQRPESFEPPAGLDPVAELESNLGTGWEFTARVRFAAPVGTVAPWIRPPMGRLVADDGPDGPSCVLVGSTGNPAMYAQEWLAQVPVDFTVEEGPELREAVRVVAARFAAATSP
jgi:predicted DNA-binding transcriptional regulator YafY